MDGVVSPELPGQTKNTEEFDDGFEVESGLVVALGSVPGPRPAGQPKDC